jgi:hypothetical protein
MKAQGTNLDNCHYLKDSHWANGSLCYWRNNANYSEQTKRKLEKRLKVILKNFSKG